MNFFDAPKEPEKQEDFWRRNSGKKVMATILAPTEQEIKSQEESNDTPDTR